MIASRMQRRSQTYEPYPHDDSIRVFFKAWETYVQRPERREGSQRSTNPEYMYGLILTLYLACRSPSRREYIWGQDKEEEFQRVKQEKEESAKQI